MLNIHEESQRCPICFCSFQSSRLNHPELSDVSHWGRAETSYTTWVLKFFLLCLGLHTQQKACNEFNWLVKTRPADFWSQLFGRFPSTLSHVCSKMEAAQPRRFLMQPHTLPAMQYRKGIKRCFCIKKKRPTTKTYFDQGHAHLKNSQNWNFRSILGQLDSTAGGLRGLKDAQWENEETGSKLQSRNWHTQKYERTPRQRDQRMPYQAPGTLTPAAQSRLYFLSRCLPRSPSFMRDLGEIGAKSRGKGL